MEMPALLPRQEPSRAPVCEAGIGQNRQRMWVSNRGHTEGLLQAVSDKCLVVDGWQPGWEVDAREEGTGGSPEPMKLGVAGKGSWVAVSRVIGSDTMPAIATGWEAVETPEPMGLQGLAQPQCVLHQGTGCLLKASTGLMELLLGAQVGEYPLCPSP